MISHLPQEKFQKVDHNFTLYCLNGDGKGNISIKYFQKFQAMLDFLESLGENLDLSIGDS